MFVLLSENLLLKAILEKTSVMLQPTLEACDQAFREITKWIAITSLLGLRPKLLLPSISIGSMVLSSNDEDMEKVDWWIVYIDATLKRGELVRKKFQRGET